MTRNDILLQSIWTEGKLHVSSNFFGQTVVLELFPSEHTLSHTEHIISEQFVQAVNDFINLSEADKPLMSQLLYKHCVECCENTSYGFDTLPGETETQTNLREFGIHNGHDAFAKANLHHVVINEYDLSPNRMVQLVFYPDWEQEHGCVLLLKNGKLLNTYGDHGLDDTDYDDAIEVID